MEKILFFHGGRGLNAQPEQQLLSEKFRNHHLELVIWHEPSVLRGTLLSGAGNSRFQQCIDSAISLLRRESETGRPIHLMGSSFGCWLILYLIQMQPGLTGQVFFSGPCFGLATAARNTFQWAAKDYKKNDNVGNSKIMEQALQNLSGRFDENELTGWLTALQNPRLMSQYWSQQEWQRQYYQYFSGTSYAFDFDNFTEIRKSFIPPAFTVYPNPCTVFAGKDDPFVNLTEEATFIQQHFPGCRMHLLDRAGHYPHIEQAEQVIQLIATSL